MPDFTSPLVMWPSLFRKTKSQHLEHFIHAGGGVPLANHRFECSVCSAFHAVAAVRQSCGRPTLQKRIMTREFLHTRGSHSLPGCCVLRGTLLSQITACRETERVAVRLRPIEEDMFIGGPMRLGSVVPSVQEHAFIGKGLMGANGPHWCEDSARPLSV